MATLIGMAVLTLTAIGAPHDRKRGEPAVTEPPAPAPPSVSGGGFTLASTSIELPSEDAPFPNGPHADVINANCTSCHSASMALAQPPLSADQWKAVVTKMCEAYRAPVADSDVPAILDYLGAMPGQTPAVPVGEAPKA
jgi:hypothetical protein